MYWYLNFFIMVRDLERLKCPGPLWTSQRPYLGLHIVHYKDGKTEIELQE
jgi:hypothetical protein